ncbi:MAG: HAMP domain-containing protein [Gammaproteobacteria bacterium]|nr:HAMP domain-containing protein [Gammaproteobacteria bacterium]
MNATWERLPFLARLLVTASIALLVAGSAMLLVSARQEARDARVDLATEMASELETLPATLAEVVVVGDFATLQQLLDHIVSRRHVFRVEYRDQTGATLHSEDAALPLLTPRWFVDTLEFRNISGQTRVSVGGRHYGELNLVMSAQSQANRAWKRLLHHLAILLLAVSLDFVGIWLVLRNGLAPLKHLEQGTGALARGHLETRLKIEGSPEFRHLITAFNHMAEATQSAQKNLANSNAELERFAEIAAHHLQEPARRLSSYAQHLHARLSTEQLDEDARTSLEYIRQQAKRQQSLVRDVQRYLAAGQARSELKTSDCDAVLREVLAGLRARIEQTGAQVRVEPLPGVNLDPPRLAELFSQLLDNAMRHGHPGHPLEITVRGELGDGKAHIQVSDNGGGIAPEYRERVFRVFERLSSAGEGTGVGLAIVRRTVESVGGHVWIEETPGGGCAVNFELPTGETI